jgi:hypothetical protein
MIFGFYSMRCRACHHSRTVPFYGLSLYARCPHCLREELSDWAEPYRFPPWYERWLLKIGARAHRCSPCRVNFVSFRPRRADYVPSWRQNDPNERSDTNTRRSPQTAA